MNSDITRFGTGARMSEAVAYNGILWVAGQVGEPGASVAEQTRQCLAEVDRILTEAGTDKTRILSAQIWLADIATFGDMNSVWDQWGVELGKELALALQPVLEGKTGTDGKDGSTAALVHFLRG